MLDRISNEARDVPDGHGAPGGGRSAASSESSISSLDHRSSSENATPRSTFGGLIQSGPHLAKPGPVSRPASTLRDSGGVSFEPEYDLDPGDSRSCSSSIGARSDVITKSMHDWWGVFGDDYDTIEPSARTESELSGRNSTSLPDVPVPAGAGAGVPYTNALARCFSAPRPAPRFITQLFLAVVLAGVPCTWGLRLSTFCLLLASFALFTRVPYFLCNGGKLMLSQAGEAVATEIGKVTRPNA